MKYFHSVKTGTVVGSGSVGDLVDWLERLINILVPDNGIEYWFDGRRAGPQMLKRDTLLPKVGYDDDDVHHVVSYVREGGCEGLVIEVGLYLRNGEIKWLNWAKTFGRSEESWLIARIISEVLNSILLYGEVPEIVEMSDKLPRQYRWHRETSLKEMITISVRPDSFEVIALGGLVLDRRSWESEGVNAKFHVEARVKDWQIVLTNTKAKFCIEVAESDCDRKAA